MRKRISYAQNREDILLARCFRDKPNGFYIDIGASHPVIHSVTCHFYNLGWSGINIDPLYQRWSELQRIRTRDTNLQCAIGRESGKKQFHQLEGLGLSSTLDEATATQLSDRGLRPEVHEVDVRTLAELCETYSVGDIDFLKIDVEGTEEDVVAGADFVRWRPVVVVVEATIPNSPTPRDPLWEPKLFDANYELVFFDGLNRYYLRGESIALKERFSSPPNLFDGFISLQHFGLPFEDSRHPDYTWSRQFCQRLLRALVVDSDEQLIKIMTWDIPENILEEPPNESRVKQAYQRVLSRLPEQPLETASTLYDLYCNLLASEEFLLRRARVSA